MPACRYCATREAVQPAIPVSYQGQQIDACETCWARIGRAAVRFRVITPHAAYLDLDTPLSPRAIAAGHVLAARLGLLDTAASDDPERSD